MNHSMGQNNFIYCNNCVEINVDRNFIYSNLHNQTMMNIGFDQFNDFGLVLFMLCTFARIIIGLHERYSE